MFTVYYIDERDGRRVTVPHFATVHMAESLARKMERWGWAKGIYVEYPPDYKGPKYFDRRDRCISVLTPHGGS